jgi:hypothetical protein
MTPKVAHIGAGVIGARLVQTGQDLTVLDAARVKMRSQGCRFFWAIRAMPLRNRKCQ